MLDITCHEQQQQRRDVRVVTSYLIDRADVTDHGNYEHKDLITLPACLLPIGLNTEQA